MLRRQHRVQVQLLGGRPLVLAEHPFDRRDDVQEADPPGEERLDALLVGRVVDGGVGGRRRDGLARQADRAKSVTWAGAGVVWAVTGAIGVAAALWPQTWMTLFSSDTAVVAAGSTYLRIVGGCYGFFGLGLALFFASQGAGRLSWPLVASTARLAVVGIGGWVAIHLLGGPPESLYAVIAASLAVMGLTLAAAIHLADWRPRN